MNIEKNNKLKDVNILLGRFQPFTKGHLKCCEYVYKELGLPTLLLIIETTKADEKHPFLTKDLEKSFKKLVRQENSVIGYILVKSADLVKNAEACFKAGYNPLTWSCGSDRFDQYYKQVLKYSDQAGLDSMFKVVEIPRGDEDISATKVRKLIKEGKQNEFEKLTPKAFHDDFFKLKKAIEEVSNSEKPKK